MNFKILLKKIFLKSQLYVSLCASLLGIFVLKEQEFYQINFALVIFLTFWNGYLFTIFHKKKTALLINFIGFLLISFLILYFINIDFYYRWIIVLILGALYNADIFNINVREFSLLKTFYVGFVWPLTLVFLPLQNFNWSWFFIIFLFVSAITFPFEIRDMDRDPFPTIPKVIGIKNTKILSIIFLLSSGILAYFYLQKDFAMAWLITVLISIISIIFSGKKRSYEYYSIYLESLSTMPMLIYFILNLKN